MPLDSTACAAAIATAYEPVQQQLLTDYPADFAAAYHAYAEAGVIPGAVSGGSDASIIKGFMSGVTSSSATVTQFGAALASYWSAVGTSPQAPNIASVNNAAALVGAFTAAVSASITDASSEPYFKAMIDNIEAVVKTIVWTITPPPPASPFPSAIS